jgi:hypothetical protein
MDLQNGATHLSPENVVLGARENDDEHNADSADTNIRLMDKALDVGLGVAGDGPVSPGSERMPLDNPGVGSLILYQLFSGPDADSFRARNYRASIVK